MVVHKRQSLPGRAERGRRNRAVRAAARHPEGTANLLTGRGGKKAGARIVGKVTQIDGSTVIIDTEYAGTLKIKQKEVTGITTEKPSNIRLTTGTVLQGTLTAVGDGALIISGADGSLHSGMDKIVTIWTPGMKDPEIIALQRVWAYEAAVDVAGKTGNSSQLATAFSLRATLEGAQDKLNFTALMIVR